MFWGGGAIEHEIEGIGPGTEEGGCNDVCSTKNITSEKSAEVMGRDSLPGADDASAADLEQVRGGVDAAFRLLIVFFAAPFPATEGISLWFNSPSPCFMSPLFSSTGGCCFVPLEFSEVTTERSGQSLYK